MLSFIRMTLAVIACLLPLAAAAAMEGAGQGAQGAMDSAAAERGDGPPRRLRVYVKPIAPFVMEDEKGSLSGFSIDLWEALSRRMGTESKLVMQPGLAEMLDGVAAGKADLGIAAVTITAGRERRLDFSHPYFRSGLQVMVRAGDRGLVSHGLSVMSSMFSSPSFRLALAGLGLLVIIVAHVIWLVERRHNEQFTRAWPLGLWDAVYWTLVTISTVGYGDKTPKTHLGKAIALVLIIFGYIAFAWFTATITSAITVSNLAGSINGPSDLSGHPVAVVEGSTSHEWLRHQPGARAVTVRNITDAYRLLESGKVDAVVYDFPALDHYARTAGKGKVRTTGPVFRREDYGIIFPAGSPLREKVNRALLEIMESGEYASINRKWFDGLANE